jgi:hypothetical protein
MGSVDTSIKTDRGTLPSGGSVPGLRAGLPPGPATSSCSDAAPCPGRLVARSVPAPRPGLRGKKDGSLARESRPISSVHFAPVRRLYRRGTLLDVRPSRLLDQPRSTTPRWHSMGSVAAPGVPLIGPFSAAFAEGAATDQLANDSGAGASCGDSFASSLRLTDLITIAPLRSLARYSTVTCVAVRAHGRVARHASCDFNRHEHKFC